MDKARAAKEFRAFGIIWIALAPIMWLMAAISTVKSDVTYQIQLALFTLAAVSSLILGIAAVLHKVWARLGLAVLSWLATLVFIGPGLAIVGAGVFSETKGNTWEFVFIGIGTAFTGLPFLAMALRLQKLRASLVGNDA